MQINTLGHNFARDSCSIPLVLGKVDSYHYYLSAPQNYRSLKSTSFSWHVQVNAVNNCKVMVFVSCSAAVEEEMCTSIIFIFHF